MARRWIQPSRRLIEPARREEVAELAEAVAIEHAPRMPVDPARIAGAKGITLSLGPYGDGFDGMLEARAGRFHIYVNRDRVGALTAGRARFTVAHELGHYFLDDHRSALLVGDAPAHRSACELESPLLAEQEADLFAACLLMPAEAFAARARAAPPGLAGVRKLAGAFGTSLTATALRYAQLSFRPCAVIKWDFRRAAWKAISSEALLGRYHRAVGIPADLPEDCPTRLALAGADPGPAGFHEAATTAAAWFPGVEEGGDTDVMLMEQAVGLGRFGALTFLHPVTL